MTPETFLKEFGAVANAPGGVQRLREMILQLAVMGKLVGQDPNDEPASELLRRIEVEKKDLLKKGALKRQKPLPDISEDEKPFLMPANWEWVRLGKIVEIFDHLRKPITKQKREPGPYPYYGASGIVDFVAEYLFDEQLVLVGEDGAKWGRGDKTAFIIFGKTWVNNHAHVLRTFKSTISDQYLVYFLVGSDLHQYITGMTVPKLNQTRLKSIVIPLPPLEEQQRITAKVDQLMALCDRLETQQQERATLVKQARISALNELANAQGGEALQTAWKRVQDHLPMLFDHPDDVEDLKKCILQNAVMGKLVPQNPDDEPASELLKKIAEEKAALIKKGEIKRQKSWPEINDDEKPFQIPVGWEILRFGNLANEVATGPFGSIIHKKDYIENGIPLINPSHMIDSKIVEDKSVSITAKKAEKLKAYRLHDGDIVMARRGEMGRCALVTKRESGWLCGTGSFILKFNYKLSRDYILLLFRTEYVRNYLGGKSVGATMTNLNHGILNKMPVLVPPLLEQTRIVQKAQSLLALCDKLQNQLTNSRTIAAQLAQSIVETITGQSTEKQEKMKTPKTELVSKLKLVKKPGAKVHAPLSAILVKNNDELSAKALWHTSGLAIDDFYRQLKTEMINGWIAEPQKAHVRITDGQGNVQ